MLTLKKVTDGQYESMTGRYTVTLEPSGYNHGAFILRDTRGASLRDIDGVTPRSWVCRCGGLTGARGLIEEALKREYILPRYDEEYAAGVAWLDKQ